MSHSSPTRRSWLFFSLYGPVEDALAVDVVRDLHAHAGLLGACWTSFGIGALVSTLLAGTLRSRATRGITLLIVAGWGACLVPFAFAPAAATIVCFALGGLIYGPFIPLTYALFQSITTTANLPSVLAARSAALVVAAPSIAGTRSAVRLAPARRGIAGAAVLPSARGSGASAVSARYARLDGSRSGCAAGLSRRGLRRKRMTCHSGGFCVASKDQPGRSAGLCPHQTRDLDGSRFRNG